LVTYKAEPLDDPAFYNLMEGMLTFLLLYSPIANDTGVMIVPTSI